LKHIKFGILAKRLQISWTWLIGQIGLGNVWNELYGHSLDRIPLIE